jgi:hypothetical protein
VLRPWESGDPIIGVEAKVWAPPGREQLKRYRRALRKDAKVSGVEPRLFFLVPALYGKAKQEQARQVGFEVVYWEDAQSALAEFAELHGAISVVEGRVAEQLAGFLASKGLEKLEMKMNPKKISNVGDAAKLIDEWTRCLEKMQKEFGFNRRVDYQCCWDYDDDEKRRSYYGMYAGGWSRYAGFEVDQKGGRVFCCYEDKVAGASLEADRQRISEAGRNFAGFDAVEVGTGGISFRFREPYPSTGGDVAERVVGIFRRFKEGADALKKGFRKKGKKSGR